LLTTRFTIFISTFLISCMGIKLSCLGHDFANGPLKGWRKQMRDIVTRIGSSIVVFVAFIRVKVVHKKVDYTEYLGPNYYVFSKKQNKVSTIILNHVSWLDAFLAVN